MKSKVLIIILSLVFLSCKEDEVAPFLELEMPQEAIQFNYNGGEENIVVKTNIEFNKLSAIVASNGAWCKVQKQDVVGVYSLQISVEENKEQIERATKVTVRAGNLNKTFDVIQTGVFLKVEQTLYEISSEATVFSIEIETNVLFDVTVANTSTWVKAQRSETEENKIVVTIDENTLFRSRTADIIIKRRDGVLNLTVKIFQNEAPSDYDGPIFLDDIFSEIHPQVSEKMIMERLDDELLRNIALAILNEEYDLEYRVQEYYPYMYPVVTREIHKSVYGYSILDNPTGIRVTTDKKFTVFVGDTYGQNINLCVVDYAGVSFLHSFLNINYPLKKGINHINISPTVTIPQPWSGAGLAYIMYHTSTKSYSDAYFGTTPNTDTRPIKIHIASGEVNGYFDVRKHTKADWNRVLDAAVDQHIDVLGELSHLAFPVKSFRDWTDCGVRLMEVWDSIVWLQQRHQGLHKYGPVHTNRMFGHVEHHGGYMYAWYMSTGYLNGTGVSILNPHAIRYEIWGPAHEVGHLNQVTPSFNWAGMGEVSVNVSTMYTQYHFGMTSSLLHSSIRAYDRALEHFVNNGTLHSADQEVFLKLVPFWQLELYFVRVKGYTDYYADLYQHLRTNPDLNTAALQQLNFVKVASDIGQTDLSEHFEYYNILVPGTGIFTITQQQVDQYKNDIARHPKPTHKIQYLRDDNLNLFINNTPITRGNVSVTGNSMTMTGWQGAVAIEQRDANGNILWARYSTTAAIPRFQNAAAVYAISATGVEELVGNW